jgi:hypothetical protein
MEKSSIVLLENILLLYLISLVLQSLMVEVVDVMKNTSLA